MSAQNHKAFQASLPLEPAPAEGPQGRLAARSRQPAGLNSAEDGCAEAQPEQPRRLTAAELRILLSAEPTYGVLDEVLAVRRAHFARGHTPETDSAHGPLFFLNGASHFLAQARCARSPAKVRQHRIEAIAMLVALIDADDFLTRQAEPPASSSGSDRPERTPTDDPQ